MALLYLSSCLPKRSETFVYREILGLREMGIPIVIASLHEPELSLGDPHLDKLSGECITVYPQGLGKLFLDASLFGLQNFTASLGMMKQSLCDAITADDLKPIDRLKVPMQAVASLALAWRLRAIPLTGIHIHMAHAPATVGMYLAFALSLPMSFTGHAVDLFRDRSLLRQKLTRATFISCISEWHRNWYRTMVPGDDKKYPIIRCGVSLPHLTTQEKQISPESSSPLRILGMARLVAKKGFDTLLEAIALARQSGLVLSCTIAGDGPERENLEKLADNLGVTPLVKFIGSYSNSEIHKLLANADIMVLPCKTDESGDRDGIPVALMEAMASGICVVSGDSPTIRELVKDRINGLLIPPGDESALAKILSELESNPSLRKSLAQAGRIRIEEEFSSSANLARIQQIFFSTRMLS